MKTENVLHYLCFYSLSKNVLLLRRDTSTQEHGTEAFEIDLTCYITVTRFNVLYYCYHSIINKVCCLSSKKVALVSVNVTRKLHRMDYFIEI